MDPRFLKYDPDDPTKVIGWRTYAEGAAIVGPAALHQLRQAGLMIVPRPDALKKIFPGMDKLMTIPATPTDLPGRLPGEDDHPIQTSRSHGCRRRPPRPGGSDSSPASPPPAKGDIGLLRRVLSKMRPQGSRKPKAL